MKFLHSMVRVKDLDKSLQFYIDHFGLIEVKRYENEEGQFTLVYLAAKDDLKADSKINSPLIELTYNWPNDKGETEDYGNARNFGHLAFAVSNIYKTCQKLLNHGVTINRPPRDGRMAFFKSPDNISIELLQTGEALEPIEPWLSMPNSGSW